MPSTCRTTTTTYTAATTSAADTGYAPAYLLASTVTPSGARQSYTYNHNGDVARIVDPNGGTVTFSYDNLGRLLTKRRRPPATATTSTGT
ncbi:RHS repeat domain-containing protein [Peterkaempfera bronchialis]|uniref:RHS repeat domain-containing protein n=1 Tax=Peterkaempfera bronchialis TaxID=2126346 RepID=UPI0013B3771B|nr:RHS repeat domain-containing protein [Peterkaempfera bronchialis]